MHSCVYGQVKEWLILFWSEVKWSEVKWSEVTYVEVLGDKSTTYIKVTLKLEYLYVSWQFHFVCVCTVVVLTCVVMWVFW